MRFKILGTEVNATNLPETIQQLEENNGQGKKYVCLPDLYVLGEAYDDKHLQKILNKAYMTLPDGKPSELIGRFKGYKNVECVSGYHLIRHFLSTPHSHYFYGSTPASLSRLKESLEREFLEAKILGYQSPPFLSIKEIGPGNKKLIGDIERIKALKPDFVWVGISSPKQDYLMHHFHDQLPNSTMVGVGGVFDYLSGTRSKSPEWMKKLYIRWLYRLVKEPKRLAGKYYRATFALLRILYFEMKNNRKGIEYG